MLRNDDLVFDAIAKGKLLNMGSYEESAQIHLMDRQTVRGIVMMDDISEIS